MLVHRSQNQPAEAEVTPPPPPSRCLWKPSMGSEVVEGHERLLLYDDIYRQYSVPSSSRMKEKDEYSKKKKWSEYCRRVHQRSLFRYMANALVVVQEFVLTCYFLAWYRILTMSTTTTIAMDVKQKQQQQQFYIDASMISMYIALLCAIIVNARAAAVIETVPTTTANTVGRSTFRQSYYYYYKVLYRMLDAAILASLVRYMAVLLRNLTASYSTDTVERLAVYAMILHLLGCDYTYANGYCSENNHHLHVQRMIMIRRRRKRQQQQRIAENREAEPNENSGSKNTSSTATVHYTRITSTFMGGTISLNAAFFATIVLVSRFDGTNTIQITFLFISLAVILFAFYPITRHTISIVYPSHQSGTFHGTDY